MFTIALLIRAYHRFAVLAGMGSGGYFSLQSSIVAQIVGSHRVGTAIGAIELVSSIGEYSPRREVDKG
jgi:predicted MFS family arabinose efflux permease